jgi:Mrp family chromosome partitioning ATPase
MGLTESRVVAGSDCLIPVSFSETLQVMSVGLLVRQASDAVIWRGPLKYHAVQQFLADVDWGRLDYLIVDCPPGTGDEPLAVAQLVGPPCGAVIVTTPQTVAIADVRRCITFCRTISLPIVGIIENMSGFVCPHCGQKADLFLGEGGRLLADEADVPLLGSIPIEPGIVSCGDAGTPFMAADPDSEAAKAFTSAVQKIVEKTTADRQGDRASSDKPTTDAQAGVV